MLCRQRERVDIVTLCVACWEPGPNIVLVFKILRPDGQKKERRRDTERRREGAKKEGWRRRNRERNRKHKYVFN